MDMHFYRISKNVPGTQSFDDVRLVQSATAIPIWKAASSKPGLFTQGLMPLVASWSAGLDDRTSPLAYRSHK